MNIDHRRTVSGKLKFLAVFITTSILISSFPLLTFAEDTDGEQPDEEVILDQGGDLEPETVEAPVEVPDEAPVEAPVEEPAEETVEEPEEEPEEPAEVPEEAPEEEPADAAIVEDSAEAPIMAEPVSTYSIKVGGVTVTSENKDNITAAIVAAGGNASGSAVFDPGENILYLNGFSYTGPATAIDSNGIEDLMISIEGTNSINIPGGENVTNAVGIHVTDGDCLFIDKGKLTITTGNVIEKSFCIWVEGGGSFYSEECTLDLTSGDASKIEDDCGSVAIRVEDGDVIINSGNINAVAGKGLMSHGMLIDSGISFSIGNFIMNGGSVNAVGGESFNTYMGSSGIEAHDMTINDGYLYCTSNLSHAINGPFGAYIYGLTVNGGQATFVAGDTDNPESMSCGLLAFSTIKITDGTVLTMGGDSEYGSIGIFTLADVDITGGELVAQGLGDGDESYGIWIYYADVNISGGEATLIGSTSAVCGTVNNKIVGVGWTDYLGTEGKERIPVAQAPLTYDEFQMMQFPGPHIHEFEYSVSESGSSITATCVGEGECEYKTNGITITLEPPTSLGYDGTPKPITISGYPTQTIEGLAPKPDTIDYYLVDGWEYLSGPPVEMGKYIALVDWGDMTGSCVFTITKGDITPTVTLADWVVDEDPATPTVTGNPGEGDVTFEYKPANAADTAYSQTPPTEIGQYTVRATVADTEKYNGGVATADFSIVKVAYKFIEGGDSTWIINSGKDLVFRASRNSHDEDTIRHFTGAKVDDTEIGADEYTYESGSVIVKLKASYLATLSKGSHTLTLMFDDGSEITTTFTIKEADKPSPSTGEGAGSGLIVIAVALLAGGCVMACKVRRKEEL